MGGTRARDGLKALASARGLTLAAVGPLSQAQLDFCPRPGRWSIGEVADHLLLAEELYRGEIAALAALARAGRPTRRRHSFSEVNVAPLHLPDAVLSILEAPLGLMARMIPDRVRAIVTEFPILPTRNPDFATPRPRRPQAELKAELATSILKTRRVIEANADLDFEAMICEHPLTGASSVPQILTFLAQHERRHQGQMERVRGAAGFPPA